MPPEDRGAALPLTCLLPGCRGAKEQAWPLATVDLSWGPRRWDIVGIRYVDVTLRAPGERPQVFACTYPRGSVPWPA